jgi:alkanesulfonate monooxygenase SsuD/methylene tetrahydromethanopterin reductase-like flavin-dependent oxidoreductase (luciferase family)
VHLAVALTGAGWHLAAWREPGARPAGLFGPRHWIEQVREAQRGVLDLVTVEDDFRLQDPARPDRVQGRLDAMLVAAYVAPITQGIGIVPAATTTLTEPFHVSTQVATVDHISAGRAGWLAQVDLAAADGGYVGPRTIPGPDDVLDEAADHVEVVRRLWDSWEDGAEIRDVATGRFLDVDRVHHIDFEGRHFAVKGPSITPRSPQGQPVVLTRASTPGTFAFAARAADVVLVAPRDEAALRADRTAVDRALVAAGRDPGAVRVLADVAVLLDDDAASAAERHTRLDELDGEAWDPGTLLLAGTPADVADRLLAWVALGLDGVRLLPAAVPHDLQAITRRLVPELRARGAVADAYPADTLRGLLGLPLPANRYATA